MVLNKDEMHVLSALHAGTLSATLDVLRTAASTSTTAERAKVYGRLIKKLENRKHGEAVTLGFDPE